jgi:hypothetical protein
MELLTFWFTVLVIFLLYKFLKFLKNPEGNKQRRLPQFHELPHKINTLNKSDFTEVIRQNKDKLSTFLKQVEYKSHGESYKVKYESTKFYVEKSFSDDTYMEIISITDKYTGEKFFA